MQYSSLLLINKKSEQLFGEDYFKFLINSFIPFNSFSRFDKQLM